MLKALYSSGWKDQFEEWLFALSRIIHWWTIHTRLEVISIKKDGSTGGEVCYFLFTLDIIRRISSKRLSQINEIAELEQWAPSVHGIPVVSFHSKPFNTDEVFLLQNGTKMTAESRILKKEWVFSYRVVTHRAFWPLSVCQNPRVFFQYACHDRLGQLSVHWHQWLVSDSGDALFSIAVNWQWMWAVIVLPHSSYFIRCAPLNLFMPRVVKPHHNATYLA